MAHQHEKWQLQESAKGGQYCAACGESVVDTSRETKLIRDFTELLSEYGVDRAGIDAAVDLATAYADEQYSRGWNDCFKANTTDGD